MLGENKLLLAKMIDQREDNLDHQGLIQKALTYGIKLKNYHSSDHLKVLIDDF